MQDLTYKFKDITSLTKKTRFFLYLFIIGGFLNTVFAVYSFYSWKDVEQGSILVSEALESIDLYSNYDALGSILHLTSSIILVFLVSVWIFRANKNSRSLGAKNMKFTPAESIVWYFVPVFNFWKPYYAMKELFKTSVNPNDWENMNENRLILLLLLLWWWSWILSFSSSQHYFQLVQKYSTVTDYTVANYIDLSQTLVGVTFSGLLSGIFLLIIINKIYASQMKNFKESGQDSNTISSS